MCSSKPKVPKTKAPPPAPLAATEGQPAPFTSDAVMSGAERAMRAGAALALQRMFQTAPSRPYNTSLTGGVQFGAASSTVSTSGGQASVTPSTNPLGYISPFSMGVIR